MRAVFEILPMNFDPASCSLICEVSNEGFSYCVKDDNTNSYLGLALYHFDASKPAVGFPIALQVLFHQQELLSKKFKQTCISYSFPQSVFIPFSMYEREKNKTVMNLMFGDVESGDTLLTDVIAHHALYNCYRLPAATLEMIKTRFPNATMGHQYSMLIGQPVEGDRMLLVFYSQKVVVDVARDGQHLLINSFAYTAPQDVAYLLKNLCIQFDIEDIPIVISGLIEENSALYKEIYKYFQDVQLAPFREGYSYSEEITAFPSHYFSNLFDIDPCE